MAVRRLRARVLPGIALAALAMGQGCAEDGVSMHVVCPVPATIEEDACTYDPASTTCVGEGLLNTSAASGYRLNMRVESGLKPRAREVPPISEPNGMQVYAAHVELRAPSGGIINLGNIANPYDVNATGYIEPNGASIVGANIMSPAIIKFFNDREPTQIVAAITLSGRTDGDEHVESSEFLWPIQLVELDPNPGRVNPQCVNIPYCASSFGQDAFASACMGTGDE